jgi:hypothetical protein
MIPLWLTTQGSPVMSRDKPRVLPTIHLCCVTGCLQRISNDAFFCAVHLARLKPAQRKEVSLLVPEGTHWCDADSHAWGSVVNRARKAIEGVMPL